MLNKENCDVCTIIKGTLTVIFTIIMIIAIAGLYFAHISPFGMIFGTNETSMSIAALVLSIMYWTKHADCSTDPANVQQWIVIGFLAITFVLSVIGIAEVHLSPYGPRFGTMESSLSILAFAITAKHSAKQVAWMHKNCKI